MFKPGKRNIYVYIYINIKAWDRERMRKKEDEKTRFLSPSSHGRDERGWKKRARPVYIYVCISVEYL